MVLSLLGLLSVGILLVQHPNLILFVGVIVGSLISGWDTFSYSCVSEYSSPNARTAETGKAHEDLDRQEKRKHGKTGWYAYKKR